MGISLKKRGLEEVEVTAAFEAGATYSFSKSLTYTTTTGQNKDLDARQCGYWTFIPYLFE
jgi:hypothetical protein